MEESYFVNRLTNCINDLIMINLAEEEIKERVIRDERLQVENN